jgi:hypothetical protein
MGKKEDVGVLRRGKHCRTEAFHQTGCCAHLGSKQCGGTSSVPCCPGLSPTQSLNLNYFSASDFLGVDLKNETNFQQEQDP